MSEFNGDFYLQTQGTAMGTKMAPSYANIFMGKIEQKLRLIGGDNIFLWKRFIDDIFLVWLGTEEELKIYLSKINTIHTTIKFTCEYSKNSTTFLDVTVYKGERFLQTRLLDIKTHIKSTNKQLYVHASSYHPPGTNKGIMIGETKCYLRTNSNKDNFKQIKSHLADKLSSRGYNTNTISEHTSNHPFRTKKG